MGSDRRRVRSRSGRGLVEGAAHLHRQAAPAMAARRRAASGSTALAWLELHDYLAFPWLCCHEGMFCLRCLHLDVVQAAMTDTLLLC